jgi:hypothetical protein
MNDVHAGAQHVVSRLMRESLMDKALIAGTESPVRAILPSLNVIQIGGLSIMDRGHTALMPLLDEIVANQATHTQVVGVGPGVRARHMLSVGLDLGLPTGALATLAAKSAAQNAYMVSCLLAAHGFVYLEAPFIVQLLPAMLAAARGAVFNGIPPYDLWEHRGDQRRRAHPQRAADIADRAGRAASADQDQAGAQHPHHQRARARQSHAGAGRRGRRNGDPRIGSATAHIPIGEPVTTSPEYALVMRDE